DDRDAADLTGRIGVPPDRLGRQAGKDADADAGSKDSQGREDRADVLHVEVSSCSPSRTARDRLTVSRRGAWCQWAGWSPFGSDPLISAIVSSPICPSSSWWLSMARTMNISVRML